MYSEENFDAEEERESSFIGAVRTAFNAVFVRLFRPFNSREVTVGKSSRVQERNYYKYEQVGSSGMLLLTENFLRGNLISRCLWKEPLYVLKIIQESYRISKDPSYLLIAADLCRFLAGKAEGETRIKFFLSAYRYCCMSFFDQKKKTSKSGQKEEDVFKNYRVLQELQIFNESIAGIFRYLKEKQLLDSDRFSLYGIDDFEFVFEKPDFRLSVPRKAISDFSFCSDYSVKTLRLRNRHPGIGVPLVARVTAPALSQSLRTPEGLTIPVTLFLQLGKSTDHQMSLTPFYQDTSIREDVPLVSEGGSPEYWHLARDFTTPVACFMSALPRRNLLSGMLHPVKYDEYAGLYMVEPYHPEKIPVVFIHGLMSSPETWGQMINALKYDPKIRQKYQFWFYYYSTGSPVLYSAGKLCRTLLEAQKEFCTTPEATRNFEQMVLVGHSMGGLITRLLLQENPYQILEHFCRRSWNEVKQLLTPDDQKLVEEFTVLPPLPFVRRAVFMAVPHRGAAMAQKGLANLGIKLIRLPHVLLSKTDDFQRILKILLPKMEFHWRENSFITGLDNLNPDGFFVQWAGDAPLRPDVVYHSIIGNQKAEATPGGSDGIVPYHSSHLNGIASECIVKSDHGVHRNPAAIRELLRILLLHLEEGSRP